MRKLYGREVAGPWLLGAVILLLVYAGWMYAQALRPYNPQDPGFEPHLVVLFAPIHLFLAAVFVFIGLALLLAVRCSIARGKDHDSGCSAIPCEKEGRDS
jgi:hypothetical protein